MVDVCAPPTLRATVGGGGGHAAVPTLPEDAGGPVIAIGLPTAVTVSDWDWLHPGVVVIEVLVVQVAVHAPDTL